jgi:hypothetical protein
MKYYKEPFDIKKPPPSPPNRDCSNVMGVGETQESKEKTAEYQFRLGEYHGKLLKTRPGRAE